MLKIGVQSSHWYDEKHPEESMKLIHDCGFESIDYNIHLFFLPKSIRANERSEFFEQSIDEILDHYRPLKAAAERWQVEIGQLHAPFPLHIEGNDELNDYLIMTVEKSCAVSQFLNCPAVVVHPFIHKDKETERQVNLTMYRRMIPFAKRYGVKLCLENLYSDFNGRPIEGCCADAAEACWYIDTLNAEAGEEIFGFCFDIGHANLVGRNVLEFIRTLGPRLTILHIHDNMGEKDSHLIPCTQWYPGGVDWDSFIQGLKEIGYRGPLAFETFRGINLLPEDVHEEGLKLVSASGRSFRRRILAP